ncbi:uncharacterized protein VTP21DRAFT_808 [Calcarisporiella thermophila]|uniref:uncharacterized protein n=1 Tax=Calcarisporiella thermophila TaxID=911321 RepID=UPI003743C38E
MKLLLLLKTRNSTRAFSSASIHMYRHTQEKNASDYIADQSKPPPPLCPYLEIPKQLLNIEPENYCFNSTQFTF